MSVRASAQHTATEQGWTLTTLLDVVLDFVHEHGDDAAFLGYLAQRAAQDNRDSGATVRQPLGTLADFNRDRRQ